MELGWGGFDRAKLDMLILIRIPFSFHVHVIFISQVYSGAPLKGHSAIRTPLY